MVESAWHKTPGKTIDHGDGFVSHEIDPVKLPHAVLDAMAESEGKPLVSRGSFAKYAEDDDRA